jgi:ectoine hydroxylase-related dioxygenase (phytanoyl-CoA dioxygenase family)
MLEEIAMRLQDANIEKSAAVNARQHAFSRFADEYERDGVVLIRGALDERDMDLMMAAYSKCFPATLVPENLVFPTEKATIYQSLGNSIDVAEFAGLIRESPIADIAQGLFKGKDVWYWSEQLWLKGGGEARRTPWHQDTSYVPFAGKSLVALWIPFESWPASNVLEVVRGSHKGVIYNGTLFDPNDETVPMYDEKWMPRLPNIQAERDRWDIFSTDMRRGDVLAFHPTCLHGGAPTSAGQTRRSVSFRFFSDDVVYTPRPQIIGDETLKEFRERNKNNTSRGFENLTAGEPICRSPQFRKVRPWVAGALASG